MNSTVTPMVFHAGSASDAGRELDPFRTWGSPLVVDAGQMPDPATSTIYDRLREIKRPYDPDNVFHLNHNVAP